MSWLQNQQLTTVCVGFILRTSTEWSLQEDERPGRVGGKQGGGRHEPVHGTWAYPQPTRPSLLDPGVTWRRTRNPGPARLQADRDLAPGPPSLPPCKAHRPGPIPRLWKRCSLGISRWKGPRCSQKPQESQGQGDQGWRLQTAAHPGASPPWLGDRTGWPQWPSPGTRTVTGGCAG